MKINSKLWLPVASASLFVILGIYEFIQYRSFSNLEAQYIELGKEILKVDNIRDDKEALTIYSKLKPSIPEIQLRILQRQWAIAQDMLHQIKMAKENPILEKSVPDMINSLNNHLDIMKDGCSSLLGKEKDSPQNRISWQVYNLYGAVKLLNAFIVLETERNTEKAQGIMKDAITDLKSAIASVDMSDSASVEKNIPRWNLELLYANQYVKQYEMLKSDNEGRLELKDNLEALIPERGGYAPGEPLELRIEK